MMYTPLRSRQRGWTLTSLMIGLLVSMLVILAMLSLFRIVVHLTFDQSTGTQPTAAQDRQATTGLIAAQNILQGAGFGIASAAANANFVIARQVMLSAGNTTTGSVLAIPASNSNAIFWESNPSRTSTTGWSCQGLLSAADGSLSYLQAGGSCNPVSSQWQRQVWTVTPLLKAGILPGNAVIFSATTIAGGCWPYGAEVNTASLPHATASAVASLGSSQSNTAGLSIQMSWNTNTGSTNWTTCLPNFST